MIIQAREYIEEYPVSINKYEGRWIIEAINEGGHNVTYVDLLDIIKHYEDNKYLYESDSKD